MSVATGINLALAIMCLLVMIQAFRMDRRIRALRDGQLERAVEALDNSTQQARLVLAELKRVLTTEASAQGEIIQIASELRDELSVMIGIGNSVAERIVEAADKAQAAQGPTSGPAAGRAPPASAPHWSEDPPQAGHEGAISAAAAAVESAGEEGRDLRSIVYSLSSRLGNRVA